MTRSAPTSWRRALAWLRGPAATRTHSAHLENVLGTAFELQCVATSRSTGLLAERAALDEIRRLVKVFSTFDPESELARWNSTFDEDVPVSADLAEVLERSARLRALTGGAFDPTAPARSRGGPGAGTPVVSRPVPSSGARGGAWKIKRSRGGGGTVARKLTVGSLDLDAIAKGYIVDRACEAAARVGGVVEALVNIGGDIRYVGEGEVVVGITNPFADAENRPPLERVGLAAGGLATSGGYRRGTRTAGGWRSHLIDPRTGESALGIASASVIAPDTATADALATAFGILAPGESVAIADSMEEVACMLITSDGHRVANRAWEDRVRVDDGSGTGRGRDG